MAELEARLNQLLSQCDDKIKHLEDLNIKWTNFSRNLAEMKGFIESAKKNLHQITSLEMSPEDRLKMTKDLQSQVKEKMETLQRLEQDAQYLFSGSPDIQEIQMFNTEVQTVKKEVNELHSNVDEQTNKVSKDLEHWMRYKDGIAEVKPWLEASEVKMAVGLTRPIMISEARNIYDQAKQFNAEADTIKVKIQEIHELSKLMKCKTSAANEVDALRSRWQAAKTTAEQWNQKMESLVDSWNQFNLLMENLRDWIEAREKIMMAKVDSKTSDLISLTRDLGIIKETLMEISKKQAELITLTRNGDKVGSNLSQEGSSKIRASVADLKQRISALAESAQLKIETVSEAISTKQEFQSKLDSFNNWIAEISQKIDELNEVHIDKTEAAMEKTHVLSQEIHDKTPMLEKMKSEVEGMKGNENSEEMLIQFNAIMRKHSSTLSLLKEKKNSLARWISFLNWHSESMSHLKHIQQSVYSQQATPEELETIASELENIAVQCQTRKIEGSEDEDASMKSNTFIVDKESNKPMSILLLVADILQNIVQLKKLIEDKKGKQQDIESKWDEFKSAEQKLAECLQGVLAKVQKINVKNSNMQSLEDASTAVTELLKEIAKNAHLKQEYRDLGRFIMQHDPSKLKAVQDAVTEADSKWTKVTNLLTEQQSKSQTLISMWKQCLESKNGVCARLEEAEDTLESFKNMVPQSANDTAKHVDRCKETFSALKKTRQPFEAYYKRQTQLISELQTVPGFDTAPLKRELSQVQQKFGFLGEGLTKKLNNLDSQLVIWKQLEQQSDDLHGWIADAKTNMNEALDNITDSDIAKVRLDKFKSELNNNLTLKTAIEAKIKQIKALNNEKEIDSLVTLLSDIDKDIKEAKKLSSSLEDALGNLGESSQMIKEEVKATLEELNKIREDLLKCEDTSGTDEQIYDRLKKTRDLQEELSNYDDKIAVIQEKIKSVHEEYGSGDNTLVKDYSLLEKKHEGVNNQCTKVISMLYSILEKHYVDKVKELTKFNNTFKEKISWCLPEPSGDKFSTECKLESLKDIVNTVQGMKPVLHELEICGKVIIKIVDETKIKEIETTMNLLKDQIQFIENEIKKIKIVLERNIEMWQKFEISSDKLNSWLKDTEETIRFATHSQISFEKFDSEKQKLGKIQNEITKQSIEFEGLIKVAKEISKENPDSKVEVQAQTMQARYNTAAQSLADHITKLDKLFKNKDFQRDAIKNYKEWLEKSKKELKTFEDFASSTNKSAGSCEIKSKELKSVLAEKEVGHELLEKAIEAGENLFSEIAPADREKMRAEIRALRDSWEYHIDYMSSINKMMESAMVEWSSFEDSIVKTTKWLENTTERYNQGLSECASLSDKKANLQAMKALNQEITSHGSVLASLKAKSNNEVKPKLDALEKSYASLVQKSSADLDQSVKDVAEHEKFSTIMETTKDFINAANLEMNILTDISFDVEGAEKKIECADTILSSKSKGDTQLEECKAALKNILPKTSTDGRELLTSDLKDLETSWATTLKSAMELKASQEQINSKLGKFKSDLDDITDWIKQMENKLKDQPMRSDVETKTNHYNSLVDLQKKIEQKSSDVSKVIEMGNNLDLESELAVKVSQLNHRYENLKVNLREMIKRFDSYVREHKNFNEQYDSFVGWIATVRDDIKQFNEIVGDLKILQERRNNIEELEEMKTNEGIKFDSIIEMGEKLYSHTSPDGKEKVREQLQALRSAWDSLGEEMQNSGTKIDTCLQQFSDFTSSQEQLTKWLKDIERHMQQHTELKPSLQEKRAQLQNHKIVHQEVTSHNSLVETVCSKAQQLVDQTHDKTLNVYIDSIRALFKNIGIKSGDLMEKLQVCVSDHTQYQSMTSSFSDFTTNQSDMLSQCADSSGEKSDLERKKEIIGDLRNNRDEGDHMLHELEEMCSKVSRSTSKRGIEKLKRELNEVKESWSTHMQLIDGVEMNVEKVLAQWDQFNNDLKKHQDWFKKYEGIFRNQQLQNAFKEKKDKLEEYIADRNVVKDYEKTIDDFVNHSHNLLYNSGVERLKPIITQISNRYQLLHVLSKEVVSKWQGIVEEHDNYAKQHDVMKEWLHNLEGAIAKAQSSSNIDKRLEDLQQISTEHDQGALKIANFSAVGERLYPDTGSNGREAIRNEIKQLRDHWESMIKMVGDIQKRQDAQLQHWSSYQDCLVQINSWLDNMESNSQQEQVNWLSVHETRSRLLKFKTVMQDITAHKRYIESVNEKGAAVINSNPNAPAEEIQESITNVNYRYDTLLDGMKTTILKMEEAIDFIQQYQDLQKGHQDWQKQMWDKLSVYTDYTGSKHALEARLAKVTDMEKQVHDGDSVLATMRKHVQDLDEDKMPAKIKEAMERDLSHIK